MYPSRIALRMGWCHIAPLWRKTGVCSVTSVGTHGDDTTVRVRQVRRARRPAYAGFAAPTLHPPPAGTLLPGNIVQAAVASPAFPWYCAQLLHFWVGLYAAFAAASTLVASVTNPSACAVGSFGSNGTSAAVPAALASKPMTGMSAPAIRP